MGEIHDGTVRIVDMIFNQFKKKYGPYVRLKLEVALKGIKSEIKTMDTEELIKLLIQIDKEINKILYSKIEEE